MSAVEDRVFIIHDKTVACLTERLIAQYAPAGFVESYGKVVPEVLSVNHGLFADRANHVVSVIQLDNKIIMACGCGHVQPQLCSHQALVLLQVIKNEEFIVFFDEKLRWQKLRKFAIAYGLQDEHDMDSLFIMVYRDKQLVISPKQAGLFPVTQDSLSAALQLLVPDQQPALKQTDGVNNRRSMILKQHKYYKHLQIELYDAPRTLDGGIKNPLTPVAPLEQVWDSNDPFELKFFTAVSRFQQTIDDKVSAQALTSLKAIVVNPLEMDCYIHLSKVSEKVTANALQKVTLNRLTQNIEITVNEQGSFYVLSGKLKVGPDVFDLKELELKYSYFILVRATLYLVKDLAMLGAINFFKRRGNQVIVHKTKFKEFRTQVLNKLEEHHAVNYPYIKVATKEQLNKSGFCAQERMIYLSDFGSYIMILPVMRIGEAEIPIRTTKQIFAIDEKGKEFLVKRDEEAERRFMNLVIAQHPYFAEQVEDHLQYFYLHRKRFLDEHWFLDAFEAWRNAGITILGFSELSGNKFNPEKIQVSVQVLSGINWFNTTIQATFGKRKASLKHLHKAIRNKTKFVQLDDGTLGILPDDWIKQFAGYFNAGEVLDDQTLRMSKMNFASVNELYEDKMLDEAVHRELAVYKEKLNSFDTIVDVELPAGFNGTLRHYQQQGLNWLNFLDEFNFGGCLADDMGLGKTVQIIVFILSQRGKVSRNTNLLVVPTTLIFNWQAEIKKFAPSLKVHTVYGADRIKNTSEFGEFEVIITSYGTLLSDANFLRHYEFNYIFLDESQHIKNPGSQRYKSVMLLKSRNKIVISGTPMENNTFDIYGQLSFACPGLLGSRQYFKDMYSSPIDKFKVSRRAAELQQKIKPFILRRSKDQVASELPEKTEMVLYCEMGAEQRGIYDAYEKEFRAFIAATSQDELNKSPMHVLKGITKLRQVCDSPLLIAGEKLPGSMSSKIDMLIEQIESKSPNHKILVFSQFVTMLKLIRQELDVRGIKYAYLTGATRNRQAEVNEFQHNAEVRVFLISLKAGGTGLNLTAADYVYLVDPWWNPAIENQAIDRCYRIGQEKHVVAVRLICPGTIEDKMMHLQETKKELANALIHTDTSIFKSLTRVDLLGILKQP